MVLAGYETRSRCFDAAANALMLKVSAAWLSSRRLTSMPAASRHSECRPSAPTTSRADSDCPCRVRIVAWASSGADAFRLVVEPDEIWKLGGARFQRRHQHAVFDVVAEGIETDLMRKKTALPARGSGGRCRRPAASPCSAAALSSQRRQTSSRCKEIDGAAEQRRRPVVAIGHAPRDQCGVARRYPPARSPPRGRPVRRRSRQRRKHLVPETHHS